MATRQAIDPAYRVAAISVALTSIAILVFAFAMPLGASTPTRIHAPFLAVVASFALTDLIAIHVEFGKNAHTVSFTELPLVIALFVSSPAEVLLARLFGGFIVVAGIKRQELVKVAFNSSLFAFEAAIAIVVFHRVLATLPFDGLRAGWIAAFAAAIPTNIASASAVSLVIHLATGHKREPLSRTIAIGSTIAAAATTSLAIITVTLLLGDLAAVWLVAIVAGVLLLAYRGYAGLRQRYANLHNLYDFTRTLAHSAETEPTVRATLEKTCELMRAGSAELQFGSDPSSFVVMTYLADTGGLTTGSPSGGPDSWPWEHARATRRVVLLANGPRDRRAREQLERTGHKDMIVAPLIQADEIIGTIAVYDRLGDVSTFDREDATIFEALANHASVSLANGRLIDRIRDEAIERAHEANHDSLTGLANRRLFGERVTEALLNAERVGVLLLDLNRFKDINDSLGHLCGDRLLEEVAHRLTVALPSPATIARLGGDEFAVLVPHLETQGDAEAAAARILSAFEQPFAVEGLSILVGAAIGIAVSPGHGWDSTTLLQHADVAMYAAKDARSVEPRVYTESMDHGAVRRLALASELRDAIERATLQVYYQPKACSNTGEVRGLEALVRWPRPDGSWTPPDEFVRVAEQVGLIQPLTTFVLRRALAQARAWRDAGTPATVAVNLAPQTLIAESLPRDIEGLLAEFELDPQVLTIEITESEVLMDPTRTLRNLGLLRALGVELSVDDFGTGFSSLSHLQRLPVHEVKIDRSFVSNMLQNEGDAAIVRSIIDLGRNLRLRVVAEGVEDSDTWDALARSGCDEIQGYVLSKPIPGELTGPWLASRGRTQPHRPVAAALPFTRRAG